MIKHSKYLQYYDTIFNDITPNKSYQFVGTFSGWCINQIRIYESYSCYETYLLPTMMFHNVQLSDTEPYTMVPFKYRRCLTGTNLKIGDKLTFTCKLRKYIRGGLYPGDLLVNISNMKNITNSVRPSTTRQLSINTVLGDLILNNSRLLYMYSLISTRSVSDIIKSYISNMTSYQELTDITYRNKAVLKEIAWICKILPKFPGDFLMFNNVFHHDTSLFYNELLQSSSVNVLKTISKLNKFGHLITHSQMKKLHSSHKYTTIFYILLRGLKRFKLFESKRKLIL